MVHFYEWFEVFNLNWSPITSGTIVNALFRFFCSDVRISGFESSANFVEDKNKAFSKRYAICGQL
jgi:hypothetical protein